MITKLGKLLLNVPQVQGDVEFYPSALEEGIRSEKLEISSTQVSKASKLLYKTDYK